MLDFGFSEILLTSAIALVVLGPERLPKVARQVGNWMGRARVMARQLTEQLEREVNADELLKEQHKTPPANRIAPADIHAALERPTTPADMHGPMSFPQPLPADAPASHAAPEPATAPGVDASKPADE